MRFRLLSVLVVGTALLLAGCAPSAMPDTGTSASAQSEPSATPTPSPAPVGELVVGIDGITYEVAGATTVFPFHGGGEELLGLIEELTGEPRQGEDIEGPYGGNWATGYAWEEISVTLSGEYANVSVVAPTIGGVPVQTPEGLTIGSSRDEVVAAGGRDGWDADEDGVADYLDLGAQEVPDTESLSRPGEVGILFVTVELADDAVVEIQAPANDFSDI